ncbi:hypothetical protein RRG08_010134 [Elysia crispata]|uniref:Uncharacterized protein n=1 Tax=Elysia crispata TaxID=231223 RepID=A0AAE0ZMV3_9GAST|nr:hypothetical protein RRG08_010134 [Elysia crispata]
MAEDSDLEDSDSDLDFSLNDFKVLDLSKTINVPNSHCTEKKLRLVQACKVCADIQNKRSPLSTRSLQVHGEERNNLMVQVVQDATYITLVRHCEVPNQCLGRQRLHQPRGRHFNLPLARLHMRHLSQIDDGGHKTRQ